MLSPACRAIGGVVGAGVGVVAEPVGVASAADATCGVALDDGAAATTGGAVAGDGVLGVGTLVGICGAGVVNTAGSRWSGRSSGVASPAGCVRCGGGGVAGAGVGVDVGGAEAVGDGVAGVGEGVGCGVSWTAD